MEQIDMFSGRPPYRGAVPYIAESETSKAASESMKESAASIRSKVFALICYSDGMTCDEIEATTGLRHQTASARIRELVLQGHLFDSGRRRPTRSGRSAVVYVTRRSA